ncbi:YhcN/YlaJ family sporulation lipoprotein [Paenisporosarcina sp. TG-14]|uniref:YhcN/YlaJ family sporulation lipoprotein n=1 Tax=Paenisporosarcina sp. TG-14 TaxID=1231057 RepID=UPI0002EB2AF2|nr:YhcN/YlaJ family sporulation lipoprotein [Paenisporosarcina sp. TG-14]
MKKFWWVSCVLLLLTGCSNDSQVSTYHVEDDQEEIELLQTILKENQNINEADVVFFDHQLVVAIQVKPLSKFKKVKITKSFEKEVKSLFPDHKVFVSSDLKISWELEKIIKEKPTMEDLKKDLDDIQALSKEAT